MGRRLAGWRALNWRERGLLALRAVGLTGIHAALALLGYRRTHRVVEAHQDSITRAHAAGVPIAMGTDAGVGPHGQNLEEISLLAEVGLSTEEALAAGTSVAAHVLDDDRIGHLVPGGLADLVVIDQDLRTADVRGIEDRVAAVYLGGDLV